MIYSRVAILNHGSNIVLHRKSEILYSDNTLLSFYSKYLNLQIFLRCIMYMALKAKKISKYEKFKNIFLDTAVTDENLKEFLFAREFRCIKKNNNCRLRDKIKSKILQKKSDISVN